MERDKKIIARLSPVRPTTLKLCDLPALLARLPKLGEDAEAFSNNLKAIRREFPSEGSLWDG